MAAAIVEPRGTPVKPRVDCLQRARAPLYWRAIAAFNESRPMTNNESPRLMDLDRDPAPWWGMGEVIRLAVPSVLNMVSLTVMQFVDARMVAELGKGVLGAQFIGGMSAFVSATFFMGVLTCVNTYASQNLGAGRPGRAAVYGWQGIWIALSAWALLAALIPLAPALFALFPHSPEVQALETRYFQVLMGGVGLILCARAVGSFFIGIHKPVVPLAAGAVGNGVNILANYVLIFGKWGFPALGLTGAGLGTVIGSGVEALIILAFFLVGPVARRFHVRRSLCLSWWAVKDLFRIGAPAGGMFLSEILMWLVFMGVIIGRFGKPHLDAAAILNRYFHLCFMPALGVSAANTALVGRYCGAGRPGVAWRRAHAALILIEVYMVTVGLVLWLAREPLVAFFNQAGDPAVQHIATTAFLVILVVQAFDALSVTFIGALRGAGDTFWPGVMQVALAWGLGVGGGALVTTLRPEWGSLGAWAVVALYVSVLGVVMWRRFLGGRWRRMHVVEAAPAVAEEASGLPPV